MNKLNKYLGYCGCIVGALSVFFFVLLPAVLYGIFPQDADSVDKFMTNLLNKIHFQTILEYVGPPVLIFLIVGVPIIAFAPLWYGFFSDRRKISILKKVGVKGTAKILDIQDTGITENYSPLVSLTLEITNTHSQATMSALVSRVSLPRIGDSIDVVYDPANPKTVMPASRVL